MADESHIFSASQIRHIRDEINIACDDETLRRMLAQVHSRLKAAGSSGLVWWAAFTDRVHGISIREIAQRHGISVSTAQSSYTRVLGFVTRELYTDRYMQMEDAIQRLGLTADQFASLVKAGRIKITD